VQPSLELKEAEITPVTPPPVMQALFGGTAVRASQSHHLTFHLKVDALLAGTKPHPFAPIHRT